jgi:hypothetical protein
LIAVLLGSEIGLARRFRNRCASGTASVASDGTVEIAQIWIAASWSMTIFAF